MRYTSILFASLALAQSSTAAVVKARQDNAFTSATTNTAATTGASSTVSRATAGLVETVVDGKATTLQVAVPTGDATNTAISTAVSGKTTTALAPVATDIGTGSASLLSCKAPTGSPICLPNNATNLNVGDIYYVTWDPTRFEVNTTITILLNYANDTENGNRVAWTSDGTPREKGFVTIKMEDSWRMGTKNTTLEFALISYSPASKHTATPVDGPTIFLTKSTSHYPPPAKTKLPDNVSLYVGVPIGVGGLIFVLLGLYFGMRKHRHIGLKSIMGRKKGYGSGKSKRERLGLKKGAIRLGERGTTDPALNYGDWDEIRPAPTGQQDWPMPQALRSGAEEPLGTLVNGDNGNAFRKEVEQQQTGRSEKF